MLTLKVLYIGNFSVQSNFFLSLSWSWIIIGILPICSQTKYEACLLSKHRILGPSTFGEKKVCFLLNNFNYQSLWKLFETLLVPSSFLLTVSFLFLSQVNSVFSTKNFSWTSSEEQHTFWLLWTLFFNE